MLDLKRCPQCEIEKPRTAEYFYRNKSRPDGFHAVCKVCEKPYQQTNERKTYLVNWRNKPENIARQKEHSKRHQQTERYKSYQRAYEKSEKRKAYKSALAKAPKRQAYNKARYESEHGKLYMQNYQKVYKQSDKYKSSQRSYNRSEAAKASHKKYYQTDKGQAVAFGNKRRRRAKEVSAIGEYTQEQWLELCARYDYKCLACHEDKPLTADHIIPLSKGGSNDISNIQPLCQSCNSIKGTRTIDYRP